MLMLAYSFLEKRYWAKSAYWFLLLKKLAGERDMSGKMLNFAETHAIMDTTEEFAMIKANCLEIYIKKLRDYGTSWRLMRPSSITDQIMIKARRIRSIEEKGESRIEEGIIPEFMGIVNYSVMERIQLAIGPGADLEEEAAVKMYNDYFDSATRLMCDKNHDYDEAWRDMRVSSFTDIILTKLHRIKRIEDNGGKTCVSEGIDSNLLDIINYSIFALIQLHEAEEA